MIRGIIIGAVIAWVCIRHPILCWRYGPMVVIASILVQQLVTSKERIEFIHDGLQNALKAAKD